MSHSLSSGIYPGDVVIVKVIDTDKFIEKKMKIAT
jgi:hypothetical protein